MKNNKIFYIAYFLIIGISACVQRDRVVDSAVSAAQGTITPTSTETNKAILTSIFANVPTQVIKASGFTPNTRKYCPENREVSLSDLVIDPDLGMIVGYQDSSLERYDSWISQKGLYFLSGIDSKVSSIPGTIPPTGWSYVFAGISRDRKWLLLQKSEDSKNEVSVWVAKVNGQNEHEVMAISIDEDSNSFRLDVKPVNGQNLIIGPMSRSWGTGWLGNKIEIAGKWVDSAAIDPQFLYFYIDPFTLKSKMLDTTKVYNGLSSTYGKIHINGQDYVMYYGDLNHDFQHEEFILQNIDDYSKEEIFKWLRKEDWIESNNLSGRLRIWKSNTGKVNVAIVQDYGFDLGTDIDLQKMLDETKYEHVMKPILISPNTGYLPDGFMAYLSVGRWTSADGRLFSVYTANNQEDILIFDSSEMVLRNYCLNAFELSQSELNISPNNRFMVWNKFNEGNGKAILYIMNLETGFVSHIDNLRFQGWARID